MCAALNQGEDNLRFDIIRVIQKVKGPVASAEHFLQIHGSRNSQFRVGVVMLQQERSFAW